jgi:lambda family phage portal protein
MASARTLSRLHDYGGVVAPPAARRADYPAAYNGYTGSGAPYDATSTGRRLGNWQPTRLGPTTSLWGTRDLMLARCHDEVRNNPLAASALDNFESQVVGNGIKPKWQLKDESLKSKIENEFRLSAMSKSIDYHGLNDLYGLQALAAREIFEGGEVFLRRHIRPRGWSANPNLKRPMRVPIQFQLIEAEQCPIWLNLTATASLPTPAGSVVRTGKEFDKDGRLAAFHLFAEHPGETMFFTSTALQFIRVPSDRLIHCYKPLRAGLLRGQPHLASVLVLLHEFSKYTDATVVAKQIQQMFCGFITKINPEADILGAGITGMGNSAALPPGQSSIGLIPPQIPLAEAQPGEMLYLYPGEDVKFPQLPQNNDLVGFTSTMLHQFAVGIGATYEQITGDLRGVNLSSIRAGVQDAHRKCEQFIFNVLVTQFCQPLLEWWMDEAVLCGRLDLPGYESEPEQYWNVNWMPSGWPWLDPQKDVESKMTAVRCGFTSRETVCAETGEDAAGIDEAQVRDNARTDELGLVYDIDPRKVLTKSEASPVVPEEGAPESQDQEQAQIEPPDDPTKPPASVN